MIFTFHYVSINSDVSISNIARRCQFTFHYVSINSVKTIGAGVQAATFTFHYVSINSCMLSILLDCILYLHSTMYLLIRRRIENIQVTITFTFHYVSINSLCSFTLSDI